MASCTSCGHQLGVGRFCTSCGAGVDPVTRVTAPVTASDAWRTDTAERALPRVVDPRTPPAAVAPPPPPRFPLYADEVGAHPAVGPPSPVSVAPVEPPPAYVAAAQPHPEAYADPDEALAQSAHDTYDTYDDRRSPVLWILVAALVLVLIAAGWWFLVRSDGAEGAGAGGAGSGRSAQDADAGGADGADGVDVAGRASAKAPETAPPNEDVNGDQVSYDAANMLDGVPETAWRAPGDATGMSLTFTLREPTELRRVGLVNGYAKTSTSGEGTFDWYLGNRRVNAVVWSFDDGTKVRQQLVEDRGLQTVDVPGVVTGQVVVRIVRVTEPGEGPAGRDFTAVSEVSLVGDPA